MPFGLTNAPATFQSLVDHTLRPFLDKFVVCYLDDILIYSKNWKEHRRHVRQVLDALHAANLSVNEEKSEFHVDKTVFLGYEITEGEIRMEPAKMDAVRTWPTPTNVSEVRGFVGFANFYRMFIRDFANIAKPLHDLTKKDSEFVWGEAQERAFQTLKERILSDPVLKLPDPTKPFEVETDASDYAIGGQLGQRDEQGKLHPVAFFSKKLSGPTLNYPVHDKELMAIVEAFKEWRPYLSGTTYEVQVYTDHKNLTYFTTTKELNGRQVRWAEMLADYNFRVHYKKGSENARADALSRRPDHRQQQQELSPPVFTATANGTLEHPVQPWVECWAVYREELTTRPEYQVELRGECGKKDFVDHLRDCDLTCPQSERPKDVKEAHGKLWYHGKAFVGLQQRQECVRNIHESKVGGHFGITRTMARVKQHYDWPGLKKTVQEVLSQCDTCHKVKATRHKPYGLLEPLPTAERAWGSVTMDFITKLPVSKDPATGVKYDGVWVVVDRLTKWAYFLPFAETTTAEQMAFRFLREIVSQHVLPYELVTDRDKLFTSKFWQSLTSQLGVNSKLSTAHHPQTDGQTERLNQVLETYLRAYVNFEQDNWVELLPVAQIAYNSSRSETTKVTPYFANYGYEYDQREGPAKVDAPTATVQARKLKDLHAMLRTELEFIRKRMKVYYDRHRVEGPPLKEGDKVYLLRRHIRTKRPSNKLDFKKIGPFEIEEKVSSSNYVLKLPKTMRLRTRNFHVSLLEPAPKYVQPDTTLEAEDEEEEWDVEEILDSRVSQRQLQYLVKWLDFGPEHNSWEPVANLNCPEKLEEFHRQHPDRPKPGQKKPSRNPKGNRRRARDRS
jgi:hypothetical protein